MASTHSNLSAEEQKKANIRNILKVALILAVVTAIEFILAFSWPDGAGRGILNLLFVVLTLVKAFYIVAEFMHLGHEVKGLILSIILPMVFVLWLILAVLIEGSSVVQLWYNIWGGR
ncbi:MAG: cytochrome C oxidase subunit IV family protein [Flammeovirgaceae bacterium]|nr:cytochrome C oxidase subunit IV family protein [Flammeovirgaceae bacterium]